MCAAGLVGTILFASEFHGQETGYTAGLAKLGLNTEGERSERSPTTATTAPVQASLLEQALVLNHQVEEILQTTIKEFDEQSLFVRPIAKRMFQQGTGMTAVEYLNQAQEMTIQIERLTGGNATLDVSRGTTYIAQLQRLADYLKKQEGDARGWIKDPDKLKEALEALQEREEAVRKLASVLLDIYS